MLFITRGIFKPAVLRWLCLSASYFLFYAAASACHIGTSDDYGRSVLSVELGASIQLDPVEAVSPCLIELDVPYQLDITIRLAPTNVEAEALPFTLMRTGFDAEDFEPIDVSKPAMGTEELSQVVSREYRYFVSVGRVSYATRDPLFHEPVRSLGAYTLEIAAIRRPDAKSLSTVQGASALFTPGTFGTQHFSITVNRRSWVTFSVSSVDGNDFLPMDSVRVDVFGNDTGEVHSFGGGGDRRDWSFLLPADSYSVSVHFGYRVPLSAADASRELKFTVGKLRPKAASVVASDLANLFTDATVPADLIEIFDYSGLDGLEFLERDGEMSYYLFQVAEERLKASEQPDKDKRIDELYALYAKYGADRGAMLGQPLSWLRSHKFPRYVALLPQGYASSLVPPNDWPRILSSLATVLSTTPDNILIAFPEPCQPHLVVMIARNAAAAFGDNSPCAMTTFRDPVQGEVDMLKTVPAFLSKFLPSEARVSYVFLNRYRAEVILRGLRSHVIPQGTAWEWTQLSFGMSIEGSSATLEVSADGRFTNAGISYPPDSQFTNDLEVSYAQALAQYTGRVWTAFDGFLRDGDFYYQGG